MAGFVNESGFAAHHMAKIEALANKVNRLDTLKGSFLGMAIRFITPQFIKSLIGKHVYSRYLDTVNTVASKLFKSERKVVGDDKSHTIHATCKSSEYQTIATTIEDIYGRAFPKGTPPNNRRAAKRSERSKELIAQSFEKQLKAEGFSDEAARFGGDLRREGVAKDPAYGAAKSKQSVEELTAELPKIEDREWEKKLLKSRIDIVSALMAGEDYLSDAALGVLHDVDKELASLALYYFTEIEMTTSKDCFGLQFSDPFTAGSVIVSDISRMPFKIGDRFVRYTKDQNKLEMPQVEESVRALRDELSMLLIEKKVTVTEEQTNAFAQKVISFCTQTPILRLFAPYNGALEKLGFFPKVVNLCGAPYFSLDVIGESVHITLSKYIAKASMDAHRTPSGKVFDGFKDLDAFEEGIPLEELTDEHLKENLKRISIVVSLDPKNPQEMKIVGNPSMRSLSDPEEWEFALDNERAARSLSAES